MSEARIAELEAELEILERGKAAWRDRAIPAEAEVERLRTRLRTIVTEWQLRCAALDNGEKP